MINLLSASTATPRHAFQTTDLTNALMHKLSPELINTLNSLGVDQRYSVMENYPDFLSGKAMEATSSTTELGVDATKRCIDRVAGGSFADRVAGCRNKHSRSDASLPGLGSNWQNSRTPIPLDSNCQHAVARLFRVVEVH